MIERVRDKARPGDDSKDIPHGPATGRTHRYDVMARTIDDMPVWTFRNLPEHRKP